MSALLILRCFIFAIPLCGTLVADPLIPAIQELQSVKEFLAITAILLVTMRAFYQDYDAGTPAVKNLGLFLFMLYLPFAIYHAPPLKIAYVNENLGGLWMWRSFAWAIAYFFFYLAMMRMPVDTVKAHYSIGRCIAWVAFISAVYALIQAAGFDQFQDVRDYHDIGNPDAPHITAWIGNPTYLALFLVMCLPFALTYACWWVWPVIVLAIFLCHSDIATWGGLLTVALWAGLRLQASIWLKAWAVVVFLLLATLWAGWGDLRPTVAAHANGRFAIWEATFEDWKKPPFEQAPRPGMSEADLKTLNILNRRAYPLTGLGLGSFPFIFSPKYSTRFDSAHNEYLEILYSIGALGLLLFLWPLCFPFFWTYSYIRTDPWGSACFASFFFVCLAAAGAPIWHVEPLRFFSALIFCLLSSLVARRENS